MRRWISSATFAKSSIAWWRSPSPGWSSGADRIDLIEPDDSHITPATAIVAGGKTPNLSSGNLQPGECVSGWINYGVTARPKRVAKTDSDLRWTIPPIRDTRLGKQDSA